MFSCSRCGGKVTYDIDGRILRCEFCGTGFNIAGFDTAGMTNVSSYQANVFICTNCGAEVTTTESDAVSFCSYCGSQSVLFNRTQNADKPQEMIPFRISRKKMHEIFHTAMSGVRYLPKEYTDPKYIDSMRGIYVPFYANSVAFPPNLPVTVTKTTQLSSDREVVETFQTNFTAMNDKAKYYTDASAAMDDAITEQILPFPDQDIQPFNPAYLAGFYADRSDVPPEKYIPHIQEEAAKDVVRSLEGALGSSYSVKKDLSGNPEGYASGIPVIPSGYQRALFPVWFLTRREKDRVSYVVANGATGKMYADLPVDEKKYWISTLIIAAVLFVILSLVMSMTAKVSLGINCLMTTLMVIVYQGELRRVMERETHLFDIGSMTYDPGKVETYKKESKKRSGCLTTFVIVLIIALVALWGESEAYTILPILSCIFTGYEMVQILKCSRQIRSKAMGLAGVFAFIMLLVTLGIVIMNPVADAWYYAGSLLCLMGAMLPGVLMIRCYNMLASRPLPSFFRREGGINDAK